MNRQSVIALVVGGLLTAFGLGVLFSQTAYAQGFERQSVSSFFPRQSELWSFSANGAATFVYNGPGGHIFHVEPDARGRLPVLTTIHFASTDAGFAIIKRKLNGLWQNWEVSDHPAQQGEGRFHNSIGVVLQPGDYLVTAPEEWYGLLASGYWANR